MKAKAQNDGAGCLIFMGIMLVAVGGCFFFGWATLILIGVLLLAIGVLAL